MSAGDEPLSWKRPKPHTPRTRKFQGTHLQKRKEWEEVEEDADKLKRALTQLQQLLEQTPEEFTQAGPSASTSNAIDTLTNVIQLNNELVDDERELGNKLEETVVLLATQHELLESEAARAKLLDEQARQLADRIATIKAKIASITKIRSSREVGSSSDSALNAQHDQALSLFEQVQHDLEEISWQIDALEKRNHELMAEVSQLRELLSGAQALAVQVENEKRELERVNANLKQVADDNLAAALETQRLEFNQQLDARDKDAESLQLALDAEQAARERTVQENTRLDEELKGVLAQQEELATLLETTKAELTDALRELDDAKAKSERLSTTISEHEGTIANLRQDQELNTRTKAKLLEAARKSVAEKESLELSYEILEEQQKETARELEKHQGEHATLTRQFQEQEEALTDAKAKLAAATESARLANLQLRENENKAEETEREIAALLEQIEKLKEENARLDRIQNDLGDIIDDSRTRNLTEIRNAQEENAKLEKQLQEAIANHNAEIMAKEAHIATLGNTLESTRKRVAALQEQLRILETESANTVGERDELIDLNNREIERLTTLADELRQQITLNQGKLDERQRELESVQSSLTAGERRYEELREQKDAAEGRVMETEFALSQAKSEVTALTARLEAVEETRQRLQTELATITSQQTAIVQGMEAEIAQYRERNDTITELEAERQTLREQIGLLTKELEAFREEITTDEGPSYIDKLADDLLEEENKPYITPAQKQNLEDSRNGFKLIATLLRIPKRFVKGMETYDPAQLERVLEVWERVRRQSKPSKAASSSEGQVARLQKPPPPPKPVVVRVDMERYQAPTPAAQEQWSKLIEGAAANLIIADNNRVYAEVRKYISVNYPEETEFLEYFHNLTLTVEGKVRVPPNSFWKNDNDALKSLVNHVIDTVAMPLTTMPLSEAEYVPFSKEDLRQALIGELIKLRPSPASSSSEAPPPVETEPPVFDNNNRARRTWNAWRFIQQRIVAPMNKDRGDFILELNDPTKHTWAQVVTGTSMDDVADELTEGIYRNMTVRQLRGTRVVKPTVLSALAWLNEKALTKTKNDIRTVVLEHRALPASPWQNLFFAILQQATNNTFFTSFMQALEALDLTFADMDSDRFLRAISHIKFAELVAALYQDSVTDANDYRTGQNVMARKIEVSRCLTNAREAMGMSTSSSDKTDTPLIPPSGAGAASSRTTRRRAAIGETIEVTEKLPAAPRVATKRAATAISGNTIGRAQEDEKRQRRAISFVGAALM